MQPLPTSEVVRRVGIHAITLERWLAKNPDLAPKTLRVGGRGVRLWTNADVARLRRFKAAQKPGRKPKRKR